MKAPNASALSLCLAIAVALILPSCANLGARGTKQTPRSEQGCDKAPPAPLPPIPDEEPAIFAAFRAVIGLYRDEITKDIDERACRTAVRAKKAQQ